MINVGDRIEHKLMPGFPMEVLEVQPCNGEPYGSHNAFRVIDPEGNPDWLCEHDVKEV